MGKDSRQDRDSPVPEDMIDPVDEYRMKTRIGEYNFNATPRSRISFENSPVIALYVPTKAHKYLLLYIMHPDTVILSFDMEMKKEEDQSLVALIADHMESGFLENIIDMFRHDRGLYRLVGELIQDERVRVRIGVTALTEELRKLDPEHISEAVPVLLPLLAHSEPVVRGDSANLLGIIGDKKSIPALEPLLEDRNANVRLIAGEAIEEINRNAS
jgi:hypothetical protein